jgi:hypothetical protein
MEEPRFLESDFDADVDLTPLIDVVFMLLLFFILVATFSQPVLEVALRRRGPRTGRISIRTVWRWPSTPAGRCTTGRRRWRWATCPRCWRSGRPGRWSCGWTAPRRSTRSSARWTSCAPAGEAMSSSPPSPIDRRRDAADAWATVAAGVLLAALGWGAAGWCARRDRAPAPGAVQIYPEMSLTLVAPPMPAVPEPPPPEAVPEPEPEPEPEPVLEPEPCRRRWEPEPEPEPIPEPEPVPEPTVEPPPDAAPAPPAQAAVAEPDGAAGREDTVRAEWLPELRRRIEQSMFYPGMAAMRAKPAPSGCSWRSVPAGISARWRSWTTPGPPVGPGCAGNPARAAERPLGTKRAAVPAPGEVRLPSPRAALNPRARFTTPARLG